MKPEHGLFVDFGSTFTKLVLVDLAAETVIARIQTPSTVETDITIGLRRGLDELASILGSPPSIQHKLASSSAAGGLRMVAVGLVPDLTVEAAKRAVLGAGAKVVGVYAYQLTEKEIRDIERASPDLVLLAGGTDGGDRETVLANAHSLRRADLRAPIIYAGNKAVSDDISRILADGHKEVVITANVMPEIGTLTVEQVRRVIRDLFIKRIVQAKGLQRAELLIDRILMPTPTAVLHAARLLAEGIPGESGLGELVIVDIGGATTDVHSIGMGAPTEPGIIEKGLPEPYVKRTVEGDLGVRHNASTIVQAIGREAFQRQLADVMPDVDRAVEELHRVPESLPDTAAGHALDARLARAAARLAMERHAGTIEIAYGPLGPLHIQHGKDLRGVKTVIGTGGPLVFGSAPQAVLRETLHSASDPSSLRPRDPAFYIDAQYILYAIGLLAEVSPEKALRIGKKYLRPLVTPSRDDGRETSRGTIERTLER